MNDIVNYRRATNAAYEVLKLYDGNYPQIDIMHILKMFRGNFSIHSYSETAQRMGITVWEFISGYVESETGFTVYDTKNIRWIIFYNDTKCETTVRFTLAHELGHILLNHSWDSEAHDREANCFARNILAPVPVRDDYNLQTVDDYSECFNISDYAARVAIDKYSNDKYYITRENYGTISFKAYVSIAGYNPFEPYS